MEDKNEIMEMENTTMEPEEEISEETTSKSLPTAVAVGLGVGLALAGVKAYKFIKTKIGNRRKASEESEGKVIDITDAVEVVEDDTEK